MKKAFVVAALAVSAVLAKEATMDQKVHQQNMTVVKMAAEAMNKELPKRVDPYTRLLHIEPRGETLIYRFEVNAGPKSDEELKKRKESRTKVVTRGICQSYARFLKSGITIVYRYISAATKRPLFDVTVSKKECPMLRE